MALTQPDSMDDCLYFTNRSIESGFAVAWVKRPQCPKCKKGKLGRPIKKNGKPDKKSLFFECPACKDQQPNEKIEPLLVMEVQYQCPKCGKEGEATTEYTRKPFQGVPAYIFACSSCKEKIGITKKLKAIKKKGKAAAVAEEDADDDDD